MQVPYFGGREVVLQDVECSGTEFSLIECPGPPVGFTFGDCTSPPFIAGVQCQQGNEVMIIVQIFTV